MHPRYPHLDLPILENLADDVSEAEVLAAYPQLSHGDIQAALAYAAEISSERFLPLAVGDGRE